MIEIRQWLDGLVMVLGGTYVALLAYRILPMPCAKPETVEPWHRKYGKLAKVVGPLLALLGILHLLRVFS